MEREVEREVEREWDIGTARGARVDGRGRERGGERGGEWGCERAVNWEVVTVGVERLAEPYITLFNSASGTRPGNT